MMQRIQSKVLAGGVLAGVMLLAASTTQAAPITYEYSGTWTNGGSAPFGPTYVATVTFDNGGTTVENQVFTQADFVSARLISGSYDVTIGPGEITAWEIDFTSDALGRLGAGWFNASPASGGTWHFDNDWPDETFSNGTGGVGGYFESHVSAPGRLAAVPEPATLTLFGLIAAGAAVFRRKQTAA